MYQEQNNSLLNPLLDDRLGYAVLCHADLDRESGKVIGNIELSTLNWGNYYTTSTLKRKRKRHIVILQTE